MYQKKHQKKQYLRNYSPPPPRSRYILVYFLSIILLFTLSATRCAWASIDDLATNGGVYLISSAEELKIFRDYVNNEAGARVENERYYVAVDAVLTADIDLSGDAWTPICDDSQGVSRNVRYEGTFDGAGHAITGLNVIERTNVSGLFGYIEGGAVRNLSVEGDSSCVYRAGLIAGRASNASFENCSVSGRVSGASAGGVAGEVDAGTTIFNCSSSAQVLSAVYSEDVYVDNLAGGIAGRVRDSVISACSFYGSVDVEPGSIGSCFGGGIAGQVLDIDTVAPETAISDCVVRSGTSVSAGGNGCAGGIAGALLYEASFGICTVAGCVNAASVIADGDAGYAGGIVGSGGGNVSACVNNGTVSGKNESTAGGIVGNTSAPSGTTDYSEHWTVSGCVNNGTVTAENDDAGGIVGDNCISVSNCTNKGMVQSGDNAGGIIGSGTSVGVAASVSGCVNSGEVISTHNAGGIIGEQRMLSVADCINTGTVTGQPAGGVAGSCTENGYAPENCAWLEGTAENGVGENMNSEPDATVSVSAEELAESVVSASLPEAVTVTESDTAVVALIGGAPDGDITQFAKITSAEIRDKDIAEITAQDSASVTLAGAAVGETMLTVNITQTAVTDFATKGIKQLDTPKSYTSTSTVTVTSKTDEPEQGGGGGGGGCSAGFGALALLALVPVALSRRK